MRIISGSCRGRVLERISGTGIRPTSDRAREAIFNVLGPDVAGVRILDLFAGTGALGLEALSRGAGAALFIDSSDQAVQTIHRNIDRCRMADRATVCQSDLSTGPDGITNHGVFDLIFMDPPYQTTHAANFVRHEGILGIMARGGVLVVEHPVDCPLPEPISGLDIFRQKKYSRTGITYFRKQITLKEAYNGRRV